MSRKGGARGYDDDDYGDDDDYDEEDYSDITDEMFFTVQEVVGDTFEEAKVVEALRKTSYNPRRAIEFLLSPPAKPVPKATPVKSGKGGATGTPIPAAVAKGTPAVASAAKVATESAAGKGSNLSTPLPHPPHAHSSSHSIARMSSLGGSSVGSADVPMPAVPAALRAALSEEKPRVSIVTIGHVDAGKSTLLGHLLYDIGSVSDRTLHKYVQEARAMGKGSFAYAWVLDEEGEERSRGVTMDVGLNHFETDARVFTLLDAPGHRDFVPNTITAISQADVALLVVDATPGEYEMSIRGGGQAKEHAMLARNFGITQCVVAVNKMDGATVQWSEDRFSEICGNLLPFLQSVGFSRDNVSFVPVSGLTGINLVRKPADVLAAIVAKNPAALGATSTDGPASPPLRRAGSDFVEKAPRGEDFSDMLDGLGLGIEAPSPAPKPLKHHSSTGSTDSGKAFDVNADVTALATAALRPEAIRKLTSWYKGPTLLEALNAVTAPARLVDAPLRVCISDVYRSTILNSVTIAGRIEGGFLEPHTKVVAIPGSGIASVKSIAINGRVVPYAASGDNVDVAIGGVEENMLRPGQVLCWPSHPVPHIIKFKARIATFPTLDIPLVPGQQFILHSHTLEEPCNVTMLLRTINKEGHTDVIKPRCLTAGVVAIVRIKMTREVCLDTFASHKRLGRFMLRYGENTVAAGMILKLKPLNRHGGTS